jgi:hypothetical protein
VGSGVAGGGIALPPFSAAPFSFPSGDGLAGFGCFFGGGLGAGSGFGLGMSRAGVG